jgi:hypothetical protein
MSALVKRSQSRLRQVGFPIKVDGKTGPQTRAAIKLFQEGWAGKVRIRQHGRLSPYTQRAILWSARNGGAVGSAAPNLTWRECKSKGNGWPRVNRHFALAHEKLRRAYHGPVVYLSVHRDPAHNKKVGGAQYSQHVYGTAGDLAQLRLTVRQVRSLGVYSGIGYNRSSGKVRHVDVRHAGPNNTTGGSPRNPTIWEYPV